MSVNFEDVREISKAYENAVQSNAAMRQRNLEAEALAAIMGAARCLSYPSDRLDGLIKAAVQDARDPVEP